MRSNKGFTLIEVLVVVAIIAILASILLVGLGGVRKQGSDARIVADLRNVANALELFANKCGFYPGTASGGVCGTATIINGYDTAGALEDQLAGAQIGVDRIPESAIPGEYDYTTTDNGQGYVLQGLLSDDGHRALDDSYKGTELQCSTNSFAYCISP